MIWALGDIFCVFEGIYKAPTDLSRAAQIQAKGFQLTLTQDFIQKSTDFREIFDLPYIFPRE